MTSDLRIRRALLSVSDKTGLVALARELASMGVELISTGGTSAALRAEGLAVRDVAELTGFPEMLDGRVKTLHPKVHGGLLAIRGSARHDAQAAEHGIAPIDLLVVNLYPFEATVAKGAGYDDCIENIDIGGPALIRGAAKNHAGVTVVVDPADYERVLVTMRAKGGATTLALRKELAAKAYARTAAYDAAISQWFAATLGEEMPGWRAFGGPLKLPLRYGENPHQRAGLLWLRRRAPRRGDRRAAPGQGAVLQQPQRYGRGAGAGRRARHGAGPPSPSSSTPIRAEQRPAQRSRTHISRRCAATPVSAFGGIVALNGTDRRGGGRGNRQDLHRGGDCTRGNARGESDLRRKEEPAVADHGRATRSARSRRRGALAGRRTARAVARQRCGLGGRSEGRQQAQADRARARRSAVCFQGCQARQVERHRLRQGRSDGRHRRGPDEPRRLGAHRGAEKRRRE